MAEDFRIQPTAVVDAATQIHQLADRVDALMAAENQNLVVTAPGRDEVSGRVAATLNDVHTGFATSSAQGTDEMRQIAATLNSHAADIVGAEQDFVV
jgi:PE family